MRDIVVLFAAGCATAFATGLGVLPLIALGPRVVALRPALWGLAIGLMGVAAIVGLLAPAWRIGSPGAVVAGLALGAGFLLVSRRLLAHRHVHVRGLGGAGVRRSLLVFGVLLVHSLPEGFAIGTAYASSTAGLGLFVILAIGLQNIPEGTTVAIPMDAAGFSHRQQFWAAVATSAPQPVGAVAAYLLVEWIDALLPVSFAFAAAAMLTLLVVEIIPDAFTAATWRSAAAGTAAGSAVMLGFSYLLGV